MAKREVCGHCGLPASGEMTHRLHEQEGCLPLSSRVHQECARCDGALCAHHLASLNRLRDRVRELEDVIDRVLDDEREHLTAATKMTRARAFLRAVRLKQ